MLFFVQNVKDKSMIKRGASSGIVSGEVEGTSSLRAFIQIIATHLSDMVLTELERKALRFLLDAKLYSDHVDFVRKAMLHEIINGLILATTDPRDEVRRTASELLNNVRYCLHHS